jgi:hypothetical protein
MDYDDHDPTESAETETSALRHLSGPAFAALGKGQLAYIKAVQVDDEQAWAVHGADGSPLAVVAEREVAFALVRQNDLEPISVH